MAIQLSPPPPLLLLCWPRLERLVDCESGGENEILPELSYVITYGRTKHGEPRDVTELCSNFFLTPLTQRLPAICAIPERTEIRIEILTNFHSGDTGPLKLQCFYYYLHLYQTAGTGAERSLSL